jgi:hypothetical protein
MSKMMNRLSAPFLLAMKDLKRFVPLTPPCGCRRIEVNICVQCTMDPAHQTYCFHSLPALLLGLSTDRKAKMLQGPLSIVSLLLRLFGCEVSS